MFISPVVAALLIGSFWTGVGATAVIHHDRFVDESPGVEISVSSDHVAACSERYRSYDEATDMYLSSRDYKWHRCTL